MSLMLCLSIVSIVNMVSNEQVKIMALLLILISWYQIHI